METIGHLRNEISSGERFIDIVLLADRPSLPAEMKAVLRQRNLVYALVPIERYHLLDDRSSLIGTVIIDIGSLSIRRQHELPKIIEVLQARRIDVILLIPDQRMGESKYQLIASQHPGMLRRSVESLTLADTVNRLANAMPEGPVVSPSAASADGELTVSPAGPRRDRGSDAVDLSLEKLLEELCMARSVQRDFLPAQLPFSDMLRWACAYEPAEWLSGDIYDVTWIDEQHIGFYIADAVGHGVPAALLAIFVKQALSMRESIDHNYRIYSPAEVIENLNRHMCRQELSGHQFVTCCYALLDVRTLQLSFARAGHPYPLLIRPGELPRPLDVRGSLLGIFENGGFQQDTIQLHPGDKLLIYSDGAEPFIGHLDDKKGFVLEPDFVEWAGADITEIVESITQAARQQRTGPSDADDITILGLQVDHRKPGTPPHHDEA